MAKPFLPPRADQPPLIRAGIEPARMLRNLLVMNVILIAVAAAHGYFQSGDLGRHTDGRYVVFFSALEMFATAALAWAIYRRRQQSTHLTKTDRRRCIVWALIALGFLYLPFDEYFEFHQKIDKLIHYTMKMQETAISDRIDDAVIATYGLVGIAVLTLCWPEVRGRLDRRWLVSGFLMMGVSVIFDAVSDRPDVADWIAGNANQGHLLNGIFQVIEALTQIAAQSIFLVTFYMAYLQTEPRIADSSGTGRLRVET